MCQSSSYVSLTEPAWEFSSGTIEMLMTAPITDMGVVISKFLGALLFLVSAASDYVNGQIIYVDGGTLATI